MTTTDDGHEYQDASYALARQFQDETEARQQDDQQKTKLRLQQQKETTAANQAAETQSRKDNFSKTMARFGATPKED
jgi:hypothetical protein